MSAHLQTGLRLCLTGDVMMGRGIDQILGHPGEPTIYEPWMKSASSYVELAERRSGPIPRPVDRRYVWGIVPDELARYDADATITNLETAVTDHGRPWPGKGIQYRMHPANVGYLAPLGVDVATLANNHVLDWSQEGLVQTLDVLKEAGIRTVGAGRDEHDAWSPARLTTASGNALILGVGTGDSGIPPEWAAAEDRVGVAYLPDLSDRTIDRIAAIVDGSKRGDDVVVVSIHWGENWGYEVSRARRRFAHLLIDRAGVHVVHGHSSHHPLGIEVHNGHPILYGCGDLINDYEGIRGHESYRSELGALYLATVDPGSGMLLGLELVPTRIHRFRLTRPEEDDVRWLAGILDREGRAFGTRIRLADEHHLVVEW